MAIFCSTIYSELWALIGCLHIISLHRAKQHCIKCKLRENCPKLLGAFHIFCLFPKDLLDMV